MTTVAVTIAGRSYRMACGEGEEAHLHELARHVDQTLATLRKGFGEIGDTRLVIMTAITLADEIYEAKRRVHDAEGELAASKSARSADATANASLFGEIAASLETAAERIERIVQHLNAAERL